mmetsp:Transcript_33896/g.101034  ORF Transcript_33896/g.101034 Transcript_33896/m.101034 type:complete len:307 (+) Transcript_33896:2-922(+)
MTGRSIARVAGRGLAAGARAQPQVRGVVGAFPALRTARAAGVDGPAPHLPHRAGTRGIVSAESMGTVMRVDKEHWSAFMFGRERQLLIHVIKTAQEGDAKSVMEAMDTFWAHTFAMAGTDSWSIRGDLLDKVIKEKQPSRCLEIGTYCGYSALRIGRQLPEKGLLVSIEVDPLFAAIATKIVEHAGLASKVKILMGTVESKADRISNCLLSAPAANGSNPNPADFVLCDHSKELFVPDLNVLEKHGVVGPGTVVMGDTTVYPGEATSEGGSNLLSYFAAHPKYRVQQHVGTEQLHGITVSEWVHLP